MSFATETRLPVGADVTCRISSDQSLMENGAERSSVRSSRRRRITSRTNERERQGKAPCFTVEARPWVCELRIFPLVVREHSWARHIARAEKQTSLIRSKGRHGSTGAVQWRRHRVPRRRLPSQTGASLFHHPRAWYEPSRPLAISSWVEFHDREPLEIENEPLTLQLSDGRWFTFRIST